MTNVFDELKSRGFIQQVSDESGLQKLLSEKKTTFYIGYDSTAESLHVGHLLTIMAVMHLQKAGHKQISVIGGGTTMIGDPSGKTETRPIMSKEEINANGKKLLKQLERFLDFSKGMGEFVDNADWLLPLNYIEFLRDIGAHFRVNEMIKAKAYELRLARNQGLSFLEFNYQLLQAYDYLTLFRKYDCRLQIAGDDQWSNMLAGIDLIRKVEKADVFAATFPLLTTATGSKMGKTEAGAVWLDPAKTSPYEFYQYWINCDDRDIGKFFKLFTFLSIDEIDKICAGDIREAKKKLAFEITKIVHGEKEAEKARESSEQLFDDGNLNATDIPTTEISEKEIAEMSVIDLLVKAGLSSSKSEARKLIDGGGVNINGEQIESDAKVIDFVRDGVLMLRKGKKTYHKIVIK
ncbi:MAG: tyrosine--tRNA ligase [Minisyncoccia bacterium]